MINHKNLITLFSVLGIICLTSCKKTVPVIPDASGLSESELDAPIVAGKVMTPEDLEKFRKGSSFYRDKLSKVPSKSTGEWRLLIDGLKPGMLIEQVENVLPRNSVGGSHLWAYDGILMEDLRQTMIWAVDAKHAVAVQIDISGDQSWQRDGKPMPRTKRYSNRLVSKPWLFLHDNELDDYGTLKSKQCRLP